MSLDIDDRILLHAQLFDTLDLFLQWLSEVTDPATDAEFGKFSAGIVEQLSEHSDSFEAARDRVLRGIDKKFPALLQGTGPVTAALQSGILNVSGTRGRLANSLKTLLTILTNLVSEDITSTPEE